MNVWNQDEYTRAWNFASRAHQGQTVPGSGLAYINHIGNVTQEALAALTQGDGVDHPDLLMQCAILHDVIEDTEVTFEGVESRFGLGVARGVAALSKNKSLPDKAAQMADSLERIRQCPREVWMVKMADRISNLQPPPGHWSGKKIMRYQSEARMILDALGEANAFLSQRLCGKIEIYEKYAEGRP